MQVLQREKTTNAIWAAAAIAILAAAGVVGLSAHAHLYADGANYLLKLLEAANFVHIAENRLFATAINQLPVVVALQHYAPGVKAASVVYGLTLFGIPMLAYGYSLWLSRRDPIAFALSTGVVAIVFLPTIFVIIGEFHILYGLSWLYAVLIMSDRRGTGAHPFLLAFCAFISIKCYEAAAVVSPALIVTTLFALRQPGRTTERAFLLLLIALLAVSTFFGVWGYLYPRDPGNAGGFVNSLLKITEDGELFIPFLLMLASTGAIFVRNPYLRMLAIGAIAAAAFAALGNDVVSGRADHLGMGSPNTQRAQVLPFFLILLGLLFLNWQLAWGKRLAPRVGSLAPLLLPVAAGVAIYTADVRRWHQFLVLSCDEIVAQSGAPYYENPLVRTFGWDWEMPTIGILLRPPGSTAVLHYPGYDGWYPFAPDTEQPDIEIYKPRAGLCPR